MINMISEMLEQLLTVRQDAKHRTSTQMLYLSGSFCFLCLCSCDSRGWKHDVSGLSVHTSCEHEISVTTLGNFFKVGPRMNSFAFVDHLDLMSVLFPSEPYCMSEVRGVSFITSGSNIHSD